MSLNARRGRCEVFFSLAPLTPRLLCWLPPHKQIHMAKTRLLEKPNHLTEYRLSAYAIHFSLSFSPLYTVLWTLFVAFPHHSTNILLSFKSNSILCIPFFLVPITLVPFQHLFTLLSILFVVAPFDSLPLTLFPFFASPFKMRSLFLYLSAVFASINTARTWNTFWSVACIAIRHSSCSIGLHSITGGVLLVQILNSNNNQQHCLLFRFFFVLPLFVQRNRCLPSFFSPFIWFYVFVCGLTR